MKIRLEITRVEAFEIDPTKKYMLVFDASKMSREHANHAAKRLVAEFGNVFVIATRHGEKVEVIEIPEEQKS